MGTTPAIRKALNLRRGILEDKMRSKKDKKMAKEAREEYEKVKSLIEQLKKEGDLELDDYLSNILEKWQEASLPSKKTLVISVEGEEEDAIESGENIEV